MATGGTITYSGGYTIHTFTSSGTFTPAGSMDVDLLLVSPGAGGSAGGGGAGGCREIAAISVTAQNYTITCASYGSGAAGTGTTGGDGGDSSALGYTNIGGGGAGNYDCVNGRGGGSGGGPGGCGVAEYGYGLGTAGQGNNGGYENASRASGGWYPSSSGGGWSASGGNCLSTTRGGAGGDGASSSYSGSAVTYGGGGGGGCKWSTTSANNTPGGSGGGGDGKCRYQGNGGAGTHYLGGGGGGCGYGATGGRGGYGVVIIRYVTGADEASEGHIWMSLNFALLVGVGIFNTLFVRIREVYKHIMRNGLYRATRDWIQDIRWFGLFWKQRYRWHLKRGRIMDLSDPRSRPENYPQYEELCYNLFKQSELMEATA